MNVRNISISAYQYDLPDASIAYYPLAERDASKLLVYRDGIISETTYRHIAAELPAGSQLVFNNTKVVEARIIFQKATGAQIEVFCLEPPAQYGNIAVAMAQTGKVRWKCLIGGVSKWKPGQVLRKEEGDIVLEARFLGKYEDAFLIELSWSPAEMSFAELLHRAGLIPLPPYIRRTAEVSDAERYQTIYARHDGSVAAPTAGLHFTEAVFNSLAERKIRQSFVTLHVGAGTFMPVKAATLGDHAMHIEFIAVSRETISELRAALEEGRPVVPVGTTSARTIESLYWLGLKVQREPGIVAEDLVVRQWDAYEMGGEVKAFEALAFLLEWMERQGFMELVTTTQLLITPGYTWRVAGGLVTNFHQPGSTLLLLIASLVGPEWKKIYAYALEHGFRFLSYGDGCLLWNTSH
ncbi:MAG: S-adenosylmethionine:tRNA ribosyltransferase-isomerase [Bacteroidetes bacterium]|nr:S-adenosylmethionine:tRNA ribosyltransferase-isomerase [Bacteroidota bacterium]